VDLIDFVLGSGAKVAHAPGPDNVPLRPIFENPILPDNNPIFAPPPRCPEDEEDPIEEDEDCYYIEIDSGYCNGREYIRVYK
jgi:hypothetical protein